MGTRGAFGFVANKELKITYNHSDSYPSGLGVDFVRQLKPLLENLESTKILVADLKIVGKDKKKPTKKDIKALERYTDLGVSRQSTEDWYCLLRHCQGDARLILESGYILDGSDFPNDSVWCEYVYIANFDDMEFEIYEGFQKLPHTSGRFANNKVEPRENGNTYYPCKMTKTIRMNSRLLTNFNKWMEEYNNRPEE